MADVLFALVGQFSVQCAQPGGNTEFGQRARLLVDMDTVFQCLQRQFR